jgi:hypothetical protein
LNNFNVTGSTSDSKRLGALAGNLRGKTTINDFNIIGGSINNGDEIGGLAGAARSNSEVLISNASVNIEVNGNAEVGGFLGYTSGIVTIQNSINYGNITGTDEEVGGFIGDNKQEFYLIDSPNFGLISASREVGGFLGDT